MKEFNPDGLPAFTGKEGHPAYVVHKGRVFDVTASKLWKNGLHMKRHAAGRDLTADIAAAPHGPEVLERFPQVGILTGEKAAAPALPEPLNRLLQRLPVLRRHPHPTLVHFPIAFAVTPALFYLLFLLTTVTAFETTAFHCLGAGLLFAIPGVLTGYLTWWLNYQARPLRPVRIKIRFTLLYLALALGAFLLRLSAPAATVSFAWEGQLYLALLLAIIPLVTVVGWYGASLTFPIERG